MSDHNQQMKRRPTIFVSSKSLIIPKEAFVYPEAINTFRMPHDERIRHCKEVYRPSKKTLELSSEKSRQCFAEHFIENPKLGTLEDLAAQALSKGQDPFPLPMIERDSLKLRQHYDSLDEELPLSECFWIPDQLFWKRVVLAKDGSLAFKKNYNWRSHGISLKFVEELENSAAEFFPQEKMEDLAHKIKDSVFEMHIRHLKSMYESTFEQMLADEEEEDEYAARASSSETVEYRTPESSQTRSNVTFVLESETAHESQDGSEKESEISSDHMPDRTESEVEWDLEKIEVEARKEKLDEMKRLDRLKRRELRHYYGLSPPARASTESRRSVKKKKKEKVYKSVLDISEDEAPPNYIEQLSDKRNMKKYLYKEKRYNYPDYDCHHINLSILGVFENLAMLTIEFEGPKQEREFHPRHLNFSSKDIENLALGLSYLTNLIIFRLRNSRMDVTKFDSLVGAIILLPKLETVDLGYDQLKDDCHWAFKRLVQKTPELRHLELEGNKIGSKVLEKLADAMRSNNGKLEYLGLGQCSLTAEGLEALATAMVDTQQVKHLCLAGTILSQAAITDCVANKLLRHHEQLRQLDLGGIHIAPDMAIALHSALMKNLTILSLDCRGSDLSFEMEADIELMLKRNRYIVENPYIGDESKTKEDIEQFLGRMKHPILLHALAAVERRKNCLKNVPNAYGELLKEDRLREANRLALSNDLPSLTTSSDDALQGDIRENEAEVQEEEPFIYDPNSFTEQEFMAHVHIPGTSTQYTSFKYP